MPSSIIIDMDGIAHDKSWNKQFLQLRDSTYSIWKNKLLDSFLEVRNFSEKEIDKIETLYVQQYKIYKEDIERDGFSKPMIKYLIPCKDSANLMIFPQKGEKYFIVRMNNYNGIWTFYSYSRLDATYKEIKDILNKKQPIFMLNMISKTNEVERIIAYINNQGQLMYLVEEGEDQVLKPDSKFVRIQKYL